MPLRTFGELPIVFSTKVNLLYLLYATAQRCCLLHLIKQDDDSGISLPVFPSRTNLKLYDISVTPMMVKKVITNLCLSMTSGPHCTPVVVLQNCEPELFYILAQLFNKYLKESSFPDYWKVSSVVPVFKNVGESSIESSISKAFNRVWYAALLHKRKYYGISGQIFDLISSFLSNGLLRVVLTASTPMRGMLLSRLGWDP